MVQVRSVCNHLSRLCDICRIPTSISTILFVTPLHITPLSSAFIPPVYHPAIFMSIERKSLLSHEIICPLRNYTRLQLNWLSICMRSYDIVNAFPACRAVCRKYLPRRLIRIDSAGCSFGRVNVVIICALLILEITEILCKESFGSSNNQTQC